MPSPKDPAAAALWRKRIGDAKRGVKPTAETLAKRSEGLKRAHAEGRMHVLDNTGLRGTETSQWKGDDVGYRAAHQRIAQQRGKPSACENCGATTGRFEWALSRDAAHVQTEQTGRFAGKRYSPRPDEYLRLCSVCHRAYDSLGETRNCHNCGKPFIATQTQAKWCTKKCGQDYRNRARYL